MRRSPLASWLFVFLLFLSVPFTDVVSSAETEGSTKKQDSKEMAVEADRQKTQDDFGMGLVIPEEIRDYWKTHAPALRYNASELLGSVDWSSNDSPVKDQSYCGSCWAFSAMALVENIGIQDDLSEQVLVSCVSGNDCNGGWYGDALEYIHDHGVPAESCYPYTAQNGNCGSTCSDPDFLEKVTQYDGSGRWGDPDEGTVSDLKALLQSGPAIVSMLVPEGTSFTGYSGGIYDYDGGSIPEERGHAVLVVGYNDSQSYFKVKNSWGPSWGESGYFRIAYDDVTDDVQFGGYACIASGAYTEYFGDVEPPTMETIVEAGGQYYGEAPVLSNFGFDDDQDLDDGWYQIDSFEEGGWTTLFSNADGPSWDHDGWILDEFNSLSDGGHTVYFMATDDGGNSAGQNGQWSWDFNKDTTPPAEPVLSSDTHPSQSTWYSQNSVELSWSISSDLSGIDGFSFELDRIPGTVPDEVSEGLGTETEYHDLGDGIWHFHCRAVDGLGHWGSPAHFTIRIDMTAPGPPQEITAAPSGWSGTNSFSISWADPGDLSGIGGAYTKFNVSPTSDTDGTFIEGQQPHVEVPGEGIHTLYVWLQDGAGNVDGDNWSSVELYFDATPPTGGTISIEDGAVSTESSIVTLCRLGAIEELSGLDRMRFSNDGSGWSAAEPYAEVRPDWDLFGYGGIYSTGTKTVYVQYGDNAGNWSESYADDIHLDLPLQIMTEELEPAIVNVAYSATLQAIGGTGSHVWSVVGGSLPTGLALDIEGRISGTPTSADTCTAHFAVEVRDDSGTSDIQDLSISVLQRVRGDVNSDEQINIIDVVEVVNMILDDSCLMAEAGDCWAADWTADGTVNILDVVGIVNWILGLGKRLPEPSSMPAARLSFEETPEKGSSGRHLVIALETSGPVGGIQITFQPRRKNLRFDSPISTDRTEHMRLASSSHGGGLTVLLYSFEGVCLPIGSEPILRIPIACQEEVGNIEQSARLKEVVISDVAGHSLPFDIEYRYASKRSSIHSEGVLGQNYPNPFNPTTDISYQIPDGRSPNHSTLKIYNILGQEVRTLVDEFQEPGNYTVTWDGKDENGVDVASGFYFYRILVGDFTATKSMVLMK